MSNNNTNNNTFYREIPNKHIPKAIIQSWVREPGGQQSEEEAKQVDIIKPVQSRLRRRKNSQYAS